MIIDTTLSLAERETCGTGSNDRPATAADIADVQRQLEALANQPGQIIWTSANGWTYETTFVPAVTTTNLGDFIRFDANCVYNFTETSNVHDLG